MANGKDAGVGGGSIMDINSLRRSVGATMNAPVQVAAKRESKAAAKSNEETLIGVLGSKGLMAEVGRCVPKGVSFDVDRLLRLVQNQVRSDQRLAACEPRSVVEAVMKCAELTLMPGYLGHIYLSTRQKKGGVGGFALEAYVIPGYKGLISLAKRSGQVKGVLANVVTDREAYNEELFSLTYEGAETVLVHKPILIGERGEPALAYALVRFKDGDFHVEVMTRTELDEAKERALANYTGDPKDSAWISNEQEMWKKTVIKRALKYLDLSAEGLESALLHEDRQMVEVKKLGWGDLIGEGGGGGDGGKGGDAGEGGGNPGVDPDSPSAGFGESLASVVA